LFFEFFVPIVLYGLIVVAAESVFCLCYSLFGVGQRLWLSVNQLRRADIKLYCLRVCYVFRLVEIPQSGRLLMRLILVMLVDYRHFCFVLRGVIRLDRVVGLVLVVV
jgi:hypothetical protein